MSTYRHCRLRRLGCPKGRTGSSTVVGEVIDEREPPPDLSVEPDWNHFDGRCV